MKRNTYIEMPKVSFKYQVLVHAGIMSTAGAIQKVAYTLKPESCCCFGFDSPRPKATILG